MKTKIKKLMLTIVLVLSAVVISPAQIVYKKTLRTDGGDISITDCSVNTRPYDSEKLTRTRILAKNGTEFAITFPESYQNLSIVRNNQRVEIQGRRVISKEPGPLGFSFTYTENGVSYTCDIIGDVNYYGELSYNGKSDLQANPIEVKTTNENDKLVVPNVFPAKGWGFATPGLDPENLTLEMLEKFEETIFSESSEMALKDLLQIGREKGYFVNGKVKIVVAFGDTSSNALPNGVPGASSLQIITLVDARTYNLSLSQVGQGTVSVSKSQLKAGESATLSAQAAQGWRFSHWEENAQNLGTANPLTVTMGTQDRSIKAVFKEKARVTLQIVDTNGRELAQSQSQEVTSGGSITFQVPNLANVNFKGWKRNGQIVETGNTYMLSNVTQNETIQAVFEVPVQSITVTPASLTAKVGEGPVQLTATVLPSNATSRTVTWISKNEQVVKVDSTGKVTIIGAGETTIEAQAGEKTFAVQVKIEAQPQQPQQPQVVPVQSITVTPASLTAKVGEGPVQLTATVLPSNATSRTVTWISKNEQVVKVDSTGKVTIIGAGETTIEAQAGEKTFAVQVKIEAQPQQPQESDFLPYTANLQTFKVNQTVDASKVVWENFPQGVDKSAIKYSLRDFNGVDNSNNKQIFEVNGQNLIFKKIGSYFLIATLRDNQNNEIRIDLTIQVNE